MGRLLGAQLPGALGQCKRLATISRLLCFGTMLWVPSRHALNLLRSKCVSGPACR